jgi:hypothetical protein
MVILTRVRYQIGLRNPPNRDRETKILKKSRCIIGLRLTKEILMRYTRCSTMLSNSLRKTMKCFKLSIALTQMDLLHYI